VSKEMRVFEMAKYLIAANYVGDGIAGLLKDGGTKRIAAATSAIESLGASVECMYYAFGDTDLYGVIDAPDDATMAALSMTVAASGAVEISVIPLLTAADIDAAAAKSASYSPPGS
jgi:uncharacterized protein with GYD domain